MKRFIFFIILVAFTIPGFAQNNETEKIEVVKAWFEQAFHQRSAEAVYDFFTDDVVIIGNAGTIQGIENFKKNIESILYTWSDLRVEIEDYVVQGEKIAVRFKGTRTQQAAFRGIEPTGKTITSTGTFIAYIRNGKMYKVLQDSDRLGMLQQLGAEIRNVNQEEKNKQMVRQWFEQGWNQRNPDVIDRYFDPEFSSHTTWKNLDEFKEFFVLNLSLFSNTHFKIIDLLAEGDKVMTFWTLNTTIKDEYMGIPAAGKSVTMNGFNFSRLRDGRYLEDWGTWDTLGLLQQIGGEIKAPSNQ